jgi:hypothetical protein
LASFRVLKKIHETVPVFFFANVKYVQSGGKRAIKLLANMMRAEPARHSSFAWMITFSLSKMCQYHYIKPTLCPAPYVALRKLIPSLLCSLRQTCYMLPSLTTSCTNTTAIQWTITFSLILR